MIYNRILDRYPANKITVYSLPKLAVIRTGPTPTSKAIQSVTQSVLLYIAKKREIEIKEITSARQLSEGSKQSLFHTLPNIDKTLSANKELPKNVLVYKTGMPGSEYSELLKALSNLKDISVISLTQDALESDLRIKVGASLEHGWDAALKRVKSVYKEKYEEIFCNHYLDFQFDRVKKEIESAIVYGANFSSLIKLLDPACIIFGHEAFTIEKYLVGIAKREKIKTIALFHGGLGFKFAHHGSLGAADEILIWNQLDFEWITFFGVNPLRLKKIGCLRYENEYLIARAEDIQGLLEQKRLAKKKLSLDQNKPLIAILTAEINTGMVSPIAHPSRHRKAISDLCSMIQRRPDLNFIIKSHPGFDYHELYRKLVDCGYPNLFFNEQISLTEVVSASEVCFMVNYCTTAAIQAIIYSAPTIFLVNAVYKLPDWVDSFSGSALPRVSSVKELEHEINKLLLNKEYFKFVFYESDKAVRKLLDISNVSSKDRLLSIIADSIIDARNNISTSKESKIGNLLYKLECGSIMEFRNKEFLKLDSQEFESSYMFSLAYLSGAYRFNFSILRKIYDYFNELNPGKRWAYYKWFLLQSYISGRLNNSSIEKSIFFVFKILIIYLFRINKFINTPLQFKRTLAIFLAEYLLKKKLFFLISLLYRIKNRIKS